MQIQKHWIQLEERRDAAEEHHMREDIKANRRRGLTGTLYRAVTKHLDGSEADISWLPIWARNKRAVEHAVACKRAGNTHPIDRVVGPAILPAALSTLTLWTFYAIFPWVALQFTHCAADEGFAVVSAWTLVAYMPILLLSLFLEYKCMCRTLPGMVVVTGSFGLGFAHVRFGAWFCTAATLSILGRLDIATISIMVAKAVKTDECSEHGQSRVATIWHHVMEHSSLGGMHVFVDLRISQLAIACYLLLFVQLLFAILNSVPLRKHGEKIFDYGLQDPHTSPVWYDTAWNTKQGHGSTLFALADASRMNTITLPEWRYKLIAKKTWAARLIQDELRRTVARSVTFQLMSSAIQPNIQATILSLTIAASDDHEVQTFTVVSILLSLFTAFKRLVEEGFKVWILYGMVQHAPMRARCPSDEERDKSAKQWRAIFAVGRFAFYSMLSLFLQIYAVAKLIASAYVCEYGVWNISGCVHVT